MAIKMSERLNKNKVTFINYDQMQKDVFGFYQRLTQSATETVWKYIIFSRSHLGQLKNDKWDRILVCMSGVAFIQFGDGTLKNVTAGQTCVLPKGTAYQVGAGSTDVELLFVEGNKYKESMTRISDPVAEVDMSAKIPARPMAVQAVRPRRVLSTDEREARAAIIKNQSAAIEAAAVANQPKISKAAFDAAETPDLAKDLEEFNQYENQPKVTVDIKAEAPVKEESPVKAKKMTGKPADVLSNKI